MVADIVERTGNKKYRSYLKLSLGDWKSLFCDSPSALTTAATSRRELFGYYAKMIKRLKVRRALDVLVGLRNKLEHPADDLLSRPLPELAAWLVPPLNQAIEVLAAMSEQHALPVVLEPIAECRDHYGKRTLKAVDGSRRPVELFILSPASLTIPYVWFPSETGPPYVDPLLLPAPEIETLAGIR